MSALRSTAAQPTHLRSFSAHLMANGNASAVDSGVLSHVHSSLLLCGNHNQYAQLQETI
jgi:hypothetical protein